VYYIRRLGAAQTAYENVCEILGYKYFVKSINIIIDAQEADLIQI
jgi:hypothetical protein